MSGVNMRLDVDWSPLNDLLSTLEHIPEDMSDAMDAIGSMLVDSTKDRFVSNVAPDGAKWKPSTRAKTEGGNTLLDHGHLRDSITYNFDNNSVEVGTNMIYAAIHQFGGEIKIAARSQQAYFRQNKRTGEIGNRFVKKSRSNFSQWNTIPAYQIDMPERPFIGISEDDQNEILDITRDFIVSKLGLNS